MNRYGQSITWGPLSAPALFTGDVMSYSYKEQVSEQELETGGSDITAIALHSHKAELNYEAEVTSASTNFLDLSSGAAISVSGISTGIILATKAIEKWSLGKRKTASVQATHYPDITQTSPVSAGTNLSAFTPDQTSLGIVQPGGEVIYGTYGITHAAGIVHELTMTQELKITEDDPSPDGKILGAASHAYKRTISLLILATAAIPTVSSALTFTASPANTSNYLITSAELKLERAKGKMYSVEAIWIPPFGA